jgi:hypothetical protein
LNRYVALVYFSEGSGAGAVRSNAQVFFCTRPRLVHAIQVEPLCNFRRPNFAIFSLSELLCLLQYSASPQRSTQQSRTASVARACWPRLDSCRPPLFWSCGQRRSIAAGHIYAHVNQLHSSLIHPLELEACYSWSTGGHYSYTNQSSSLCASLAVFNCLLLPRRILILAAWRLQVVLFRPSVAPFSSACCSARNLYDKMLARFWLPFSVRRSPSDTVSSTLAPLGSLFRRLWHRWALFLLFVRRDRYLSTATTTSTRSIFVTLTASVTSAMGTSRRWQCD